jgi:hypothetical protein
MEEKLASPPIVEVVCGLCFDPIPELDPIAVGKFWHDLRGEYPKHAVQPAVTDQASLMLAFGPGPLRSWFISTTDEYVIQIQHDRFYLNWRKRDAGYPRFNNYGQEKGVMSRALEEFERFSTFCSEAFGLRPRVGGAEVAKVDLLVEGPHWRDTADLARLMPMIGTLHAHARAEDADLTARIAETRPEGDFVLTVHFGMQSIFGVMPARGLRLETRLHRAIPRDNPDLREQLASLNAGLNKAFFGLFEPKELARFGGIA